jgi:hypothetical protein
MILETDTGGVFQVLDYTLFQLRDPSEMQVCDSWRESRQLRWLHLELERSRTIRLLFIVRTPSTPAPSI